MYGSLQNRMAESRNFDLEQVQIGDGATETFWSDCLPYTVVDVIRFVAGARKGQIKGFVLQADDYTPAEDYDYFSNQKYIYTQNKRNSKVDVIKRKNGKFTDKHGRTYAIGFRRKYQDPTF